MADCIDTALISSAFFWNLREARCEVNRIKSARGERSQTTAFETHFAPEERPTPTPRLLCAIISIKGKGQQAIGRSLFFIPVRHEVMHDDRSLSK
jgi:hypothetical protein